MPTKRLIHVIAKKNARLAEAAEADNNRKVGRLTRVLAGLRAELATRPDQDTAAAATSEDGAGEADDSWKHCGFRKWGGRHGGRHGGRRGGRRGGCCGGKGGRGKAQLSEDDFPVLAKVASFGDAKLARVLAKKEAALEDAMASGHVMRIGRLSYLCAKLRAIEGERRAGVSATSGGATTTDGGATMTTGGTDSVSSASPPQARRKCKATPMTLVSMAPAATADEEAEALPIIRRAKEMPTQRLVEVLEHRRGRLAKMASSCDRPRRVQRMTRVVAGLEAELATRTDRPTNNDVDAGAESGSGSGSGSGALSDRDFPVIGRAIDGGMPDRRLAKVIGKKKKAMKEAMATGNAKRSGRLAYLVSRLESVLASRKSGGENPASTAMNLRADLVSGGAAKARKARHNRVPVTITMERVEANADSGSGSGSSSGAVAAAAAASEEIAALDRAIAVLQARREALAGGCPRSAQVFYC